MSSALPSGPGFKGLVYRYFAPLSPQLSLPFCCSKIFTYCPIIMETPDFGDLLVVIGRFAIRHDHVASAISSRTGEVDPRRVLDPDKPYTFTLTVVELPNSGEVEVPGVSTGRVFCVSPWALAAYDFTMGSWLYTVRDTAIVSCFANYNSGVYNEGEAGLLRLPKELVIPYFGQAVPTPTDVESPALVDLWRRIDPYDHRFVGLLFPLSYPLAAITGQWDIEPAGARLDQFAGTWEAEKARREILYSPEERASMLAAADKERQELARIDQEMKELLRDPPEGSSVSDEDGAEAEEDGNDEGSEVSSSPIRVEE
ncbi:uncharacterized protein STEHIDRAFT_114665 [Stereum hirsutum FP-91666 SS1]|uniref:uncharacterized protein n=1 Tax=Stereum hirsutum (strain FP-91666) TaxID=721885 RepID=UPI000444A59C|nr:uncharacterized protein STEHIDRAFT_114665 [Stereum hirsutum FP-91666 SS1]EIM81990.1 hypothetical protein STEHIDRAFT_114665 [Stereum hirsutum FP-91666 SS1]